MRAFLTFAFCYLMLALMWVGAEYVFEGMVHSSHVDGVVCALLARYVQRGMDGDGNGPA